MLDRLIFIFLRQKYQEYDLFLSANALSWRDWTLGIGWIFLIALTITIIRSSLLSSYFQMYTSLVLLSYSLTHKSWSHWTSASNQGKECEDLRSCPSLLTSFYYAHIIDSAILLPNTYLTRLIRLHQVGSFNHLNFYTSFLTFVLGIWFSHTFLR